MSSLVRKGTTAISSEQGSSFVEYLIVIGFCALMVAPAVYSLGLPLLRWFRFTQLVLLSPV